MKPASTGSARARHNDGNRLGRILRRQRRAPPETTIRSTLRRTRSAASSGSRSRFSSANRYSMAMFCPFYVAKLAQRLPNRLGTGGIRAAIDR